MNMAKFTDSQKRIIRVWSSGELRRINLLEGSVRSGKTWVSLYIWAFFLCEASLISNYIMVGKSLFTLKRNCLDPLVEITGGLFKYSLSKKEGSILGRRVYLEGANDSRAESKIRGLTLMGAYCDELTLIDEDFFQMLLSRLSEPKAMLIATTNPDSPSHWLKKKYIDRSGELDMLRVKLSIDDNVFLEKSYIENIKKEYSGVFYDRYILGNWTVAQGAVYGFFCENKRDIIIDSPPESVFFSHIGVDFGGSGSAHAFVLTGFSRDLKEVCVLDEWYFKGGITPLELELEFIRFVRKNMVYNPIAAYMDSAEQVLIRGIKAACAREGINIRINNARKGSIIGRIRFYTAIMARGAYKVMRHCEMLIEAFESATYNPKILKDERVDDGSANIDSLDAAEYSTESLQDNIIKVLGGMVF